MQTRHLVQELQFLVLMVYSEQQQLQLQYLVQCPELCSLKDDLASTPQWAEDNLSLFSYFIFIFSEY
jgi:hypothetical protein